MWGRRGDGGDTALQHSVAAAAGMATAKGLVRVMALHPLLLDGAQERYDYFRLAMLAHVSRAVTHWPLLLIKQELFAAAAVLLAPRYADVETDMTLVCLVCVMALRPLLLDGAQERYGDFRSGVAGRCQSSSDRPGCCCCCCLDWISLQRFFLHLLLG